MIRTNLIHASIPPSYWNYALSFVTYLLNILPSTTINNHTPTSILYHRIPTYSHLRTFGCLCYPNTSATTSHKLIPRSIPSVFLGYPPNHRGYLCHDLNTNQSIISRHVTFHEDILLLTNFSKLPTTSYDFLSDIPPSPYVIYHSIQPNSSSTPSVPSSTPISNRSTATTPPHHPHPMQTRSKNGIFEPNHQFSLHTQPVSPLPTNPKLALLDPNWKNVMFTEFNALLKQNTWDLVPRPLDANVIRCHWIFRHKSNADGTLERYKARLVVNGKYQEVGSIARKLLAQL